MWLLTRLNWTIKLNGIWSHQNLTFLTNLKTASSLWPSSTEAEQRNWGFTRKNRQSKAASRNQPINRLCNHTWEKVNSTEYEHDNDCRSGIQFLFGMLTTPFFRGAECPPIKIGYSSMIRLASTIDQISVSVNAIEAKSNSLESVKRYSRRGIKPSPTPYAFWRGQRRHKIGHTSLNFSWMLSIKAT